MAATSAARVADLGGLQQRASSAESLARPALLALQEEAIAAKRAVDVVLARVAAEIARRSTRDDGQAGLARREGFGSPQQLIAAKSGATTGEADRLMTLGRVLADAEAPAGQERPAGKDPRPRFEVLAAAIKAGELSAEAGALVARTLDRLASQECGAERLRDLESRVVHKAIGLSIAKVRRLLAHAEAQVNPRELVEREAKMFEERFASLRDEPDGSVTLTARLDPASAAPVRAFIDGYVRKAFQERRDALAAGAASDPAPQAGQLRADALAWLARHAQGCEAEHGGVKTTVVVRLGLDELRRGTGVAEIDGMAMPVSVATARRLAADAEVIPVVLGASGEVLDWGRRRRLFTRDQRQALVERDGGCAKCHAPPDWCEAHHIRWWERDSGPTDLANGVLLCTRCHHDIHRDGWRISVKDQRVWFTPPRAIDPAQKPLLGGRARIRADL